MTIGEAHIHAHRGQIVRALVKYGGSAFTDAYVDAMADAGIFNRAHAAIAIPRARAILGFYPGVCHGCDGEGVVAAGTSTTVSATTTVRIDAIRCRECEGAGFDGLLGYGESARVKVAAPATVPR